MGKTNSFLCKSIDLDISSWILKELAFNLADFVCKGINFQPVAIAAKNLLSDQCTIAWKIKWESTKEKRENDLDQPQFSALSRFTGVWVRSCGLDTRHALTRLPVPMCTVALCWQSVIFLSHGSISTTFVSHCWLSWWSGFCPEERGWVGMRGLRESSECFQNLDECATYVQFTIKQRWG